MRHQPVGPAVEHREVVTQPRRDVVGVQDRDLRRARQAVAAHEHHVRRRDREDPRRPVRRARHVRRQEGGEVLAHRDRAHARSSPAVRDAERLVQVEVRHVGAELARLRDADERVQVGAVEVHLPAALVHERAHVADVRLEHAVRRRVRDHQRRQVGGVLVRLRLQVVEVDVAVVVALDDDHAHARHHRARRVGAVRRLRDQADGPGLLAAARVVRADREQTGELALGAGVGLQRHRVVAGDLAQRALEVVEQLAVARGLLLGHERVHGRELRPRDRHHLGGAVELHRARARAGSSCGRARGRGRRGGAGSAASASRSGTCGRRDA